MEKRMAEVDVDMAEKYGLVGDELDEDVALVRRRREGGVEWRWMMRRRLGLLVRMIVMLSWRKMRFSMQTVTA
eukprot:scaffold1003_cov79-Skeletonema_menzelii.AAC.2